MREPADWCRLFTATAGTGQVIVATHHRHLIDIARRTCSEVTVHELPAKLRAPHRLLNEVSSDLAARRGINHQAIAAQAKRQNSGLT